MTKCEYLLNMADKCTARANIERDPNLKKFYANAAIGFRIKLEKLSLEECGEQVCK